MATNYRDPKAAERLIEAACAIDQCMTWNTTPEGQDYWEIVKIKLLAHGAEAAKLKRTSPLSSAAQVEVDPVKALREKVNKALQQSEAKA